MSIYPDSALVIQMALDHDLTIESGWCIVHCDMILGDGFTVSIKDGGKLLLL